MSTASKDTATSVAVTAATQHAPDAATPAETTEALGVSAPLLALTKEAAVWASRAPRPAAHVDRPDVEFSVYSDSDITLYTPDGTSPTLFWRSPLLSPPDQLSDYPGDAGGFTRGVRGIHSALPVDTEAARLAAVAGMSTPNPTAQDFSAKLTSDIAAVNIWRFGPGAFAIDVCIGAEAQDFNRLTSFTIRTTHPATLFEAYVPAGGFYRPIGGKVSLRRVNSTEITAELDLRRAELRNTFLRVIVAWELAVTGDSPQQCLAAIRAPRALAAPPEGAVLAGGAVVGNPAHPITSSLNYGFCNFVASGMVAATSPGGYGVLVGDHQGNSALFGDGVGCVFSVSGLQVDAENYAFMLNFIAVGDWRGNQDPRSVLKLEANIDGNTWVAIADYSFSNNRALPQSYPAPAGEGDYAAMTGRGRINRYQFSGDTPMLVVDTYHKEASGWTPTNIASIPMSEYAPVDSTADTQEDQLIAGAGTADARVLLYRQFGVDVRGVKLPNMDATSTFIAAGDTEYRLVVPIHTNARAFKLRVTAKKAWALSAVQLWAQVTRINVPTAGVNDIASSAVDTADIVVFDDTNLGYSSGGRLRTETDVELPEVEVVDSFHLLREYDRRKILNGGGGPWFARSINDGLGIGGGPTEYANIHPGGVGEPVPGLTWGGRTTFPFTPQEDNLYLRIHLEHFICWPLFKRMNVGTSELYFKPMANLRAAGFTALHDYLTEQVLAKTSLKPHQISQMLVYDVYATLAGNKHLAEMYHPAAPGTFTPGVINYGDILYQYGPEYMLGVAGVPGGADILGSLAAAERIVGYRLPQMYSLRYDSDYSQFAGSVYTGLPLSAGVQNLPDITGDDASSGDVLPPREPGKVVSYNPMIFGMPPTAAQLGGEEDLYRCSEDGLSIFKTAKVVGNACGTAFEARIRFAHDVAASNTLTLGETQIHSPISGYVVSEAPGCRFVTKDRLSWKQRQRMSAINIEVPLGAANDLTLELIDGGEYEVNFGLWGAWAEVVKYPVPELRPGDEQPPPIVIPGGWGDEPEGGTGGSGGSGGGSGGGGSGGGGSGGTPDDTPTRMITGSRRPWPEAWYTELLEGHPGEEWGVLGEELSGDDDPEEVPVLTTDSTDVCMGPFRDTKLVLTLKDIPQHTQLVIGLEFFIMGPWEGSSAAHPHTLRVRRVRGVVRDNVWDATVATVSGAQQTYPNRSFTAGSNTAGTLADATGTLFYDSHSAVYVAEFDIDHTHEDVVLEIGAENLPEGCTWGLARAYVKPSFLYTVNEAFDAARFPAPLIKPKDIPAIVVGRSLLGDGFESDLVFVNLPLPVKLHKDSNNEVRRLRFPVFGTPNDVARFWQQAEAQFSSSPARVFDLRAERVGFASPDKYPEKLNPMAVLLGHVMAGNLLILKLSAYGDSIPISVFNDLRKRLPMSCGLLLHTEIEVGSESVLEPGAVEVFDAVVLEDSHPVVGNPYVRVWGDPENRISLFAADGTELEAGEYLLLQTGETCTPEELGGEPDTFVPDAGGFQWWQHSDTPMIAVYRGLAPGQLTISIWNALRRTVTAYLLLGNADILGITVPEGGTAEIEHGILKLTVTRDSLTELKDFVIKWALRTSMLSEEPVVTGYME